MLEVKDLVKTFGNYTAVDHVSFQIPMEKSWANWPKRGWEDNDFSFDLGFFDTRPRRSVMEWPSSWEKDYDVIGYLPEERDFIRK